ncbi:MAG: hypothetical protein RRZ85_07830 [Gordonibacter sp.]|uniref:hypothetical protein n=1 Tax=Gordonibacter sp. TaxID=1968902 RepID=UPI002FC704A4
MDIVREGKLTFGRDQVVTSSHAAKNFGEMRRRAKEEPLYVSDRNDGIDTVIVDFDTFEALAVELENFRVQRLYDTAAIRLQEGDADLTRQPVGLAEVLGEKSYAEWLSLDADAIADKDLFE